MKAYIVKDEINYYKLEDASRRSGILNIGETYSIETDIPDEISDTYRIAVFKDTTDSDESSIGWVNYKDFIENSELVESVDNTTEDNNSVKDIPDIEPEIAIDIAINEDKTVVNNQPYINELYPTIHIKRGITFDYDNKATGHLPNDYILLEEKNGIALVRNKASRLLFRFAVSSLDR